MRKGRKKAHDNLKDNTNNKRRRDKIEGKDIRKEYTMSAATRQQDKGEYNTEEINK